MGTNSTPFGSSLQKPLEAPPTSENIPTPQTTLFCGEISEIQGLHLRDISYINREVPKLNDSTGKSVIGASLDARLYSSYRNDEQFMPMMYSHTNVGLVVE